MEITSASISNELMESFTSFFLELVFFVSFYFFISPLRRCSYSFSLELISAFPRNFCSGAFLGKAFLRPLVTGAAASLYASRLYWYTKVVVWSIPRYSLMSMVVFKFWETLALSSNKIVKARNHIICSTFVLAYNRNSRVEVWSIKLKPSSACFLLLKLEKKLFYCFFLFDWGSISI